MNWKFKLLLLSATVLSLTACNQEKKTNEESETIKVDDSISAPSGEVLTKEQQEALTPDDVIELLKEGNIRFINDDMTVRNHTEQIRKSAKAQFPKAIVLSCVDSRVPVEDVFDLGIGDLFVARVAGNFVNEDILGSMEFACKVSGSKLVLIMGHEHCGAIKAAVDDVKLGNITSMLQNIRPAVESVEYEGERNSENQEFVQMVAERNVLVNNDKVRDNSPILKEMEDTGEIKIVGAVYDMDNGKVVWLE